MDSILPHIPDESTAYSHIPEHGFSLFLAKRTKTIHFIRHAEGEHNEANRNYGDDTPVTFSTEGAWDYQDAKLTKAGIAQCQKVRREQLHDIRPELIVVSPFTRTLQTAHIMFTGKNIPFLVHEGCAERRGKFTCDKRRDKQTIIEEMLPIYRYTNDRIDFDSFGYSTEEDEIWTQEREAGESVIRRGIEFIQWIATRPENELAVVTHSSWLKHLFRAFGEQTHTKDTAVLHRLAGNAELRSVTLALHRGFYPPGDWEETIHGEEVFVPHHHSFRTGRYAPPNAQVAGLHQRLAEANKGKTLLKKHESEPV